MKESVIICAQVNFSGPTASLLKGRGRGKTHDTDTGNDSPVSRPGF